MSPAVFLLLAVALAVVGSLVVVARHRGPSSVDAGMERFAREMRALAPREHRHVRPGDD